MTLDSAIHDDLLLQVSRILDLSTSLKRDIPDVLDALGKQTGVQRVVLALFDRETGELVMESASGLPHEHMRHGRFQAGEGITGRVIETGEAEIVPSLADEPRFLDRAIAKGLGAENNLSMVCVPVTVAGEVVGTLSALFSDTPPEELTAFARYLRIVASMLARAAHKRRIDLEDDKELREQNMRLQAQLEEQFQPSNIIGRSKSMRDLYQHIAQVSPSDATVLLRGESGVGKELVAHAIHFNSPRAQKPFVKVNCAALPKTILSSELFGHERGSFTGAVNQRKGRFEQAHGGTLFLDEIGDFTPATQVALLRILQERAFERVGGNRTIEVDVRIIAATNRDLEELIEDGSWRSDLYYRLNVFPIWIPPLRERKIDIPLLADHFVEKYARRNKKDIQRISAEALDMLLTHPWPGNVRELENCMERAVLVCRDRVIRAFNLPPSLQTGRASGTSPRGTLPQIVETTERELISDALVDASGNMASAARELGITERQIRYRIKRYNLDPTRFKGAGD